MTSAHLPQEVYLDDALRFLQCPTGPRGGQLPLGRLVEDLTGGLELIEDGVDRRGHVFGGVVPQDERVEDVPHLHVLGDRVKVAGDLYDSVRLAQESLVEGTAGVLVIRVGVQPAWIIFVSSVFLD